jgi:Zn finger protein HypA/HybF involved in hydrogenase expression
MIVKHCSRCQADITIPALSPQVKVELMQLKNAQKPLHVVKIIQEKTGLGLAVAKGLTMHMNQKRGHCHRCNYGELRGENVICPKCKSLNLNW